MIHQARESVATYGKTSESAYHKPLLSIVSCLGYTVAQNELFPTKVGGVTEGVVELQQVWLHGYHWQHLKW